MLEYNVSFTLQEFRKLMDVLGDVPSFQSKFYLRHEDLLNKPSLFQECSEDYNGLRLTLSQDDMQHILGRLGGCPVAVVGRLYQKLCSLVGEIVDHD